MQNPHFPVLCCPLPYRVAPVFVQVVSPPLGWSPLSSFPVIWSPSGGTRGPSVVFEAVDMPCPGPFHFSHSVDISMTFVLFLTQMLVFLYLYVMLALALGLTMSDKCMNLDEIYMLRGIDCIDRIGLLPFWSVRLHVIFE